jgi:hypothetical protein
MGYYIQFIFMILFGCSCWALGNYVLDYFFSGKKYLFLPWARPVIAFTLGNVIFSYALTGLGFLGLYSPLVFDCLFLFGIAVFLFQLLLKLKCKITLNGQQNKIVQSSASVNKIKNGESAAIIVLCIVIAIFLIPLTMQAAIPPFFRDSLVYHLLLPKLYLQTGHLTYINGNVYSAFPKGHEVLMTLLMSVAGDRAAQGFSILQYVGTIVGIYSIARCISEPWPAAICSMGFATVPPAVYFSGCGYVEPALIMTLTSSILLLIHFIRDDLPIHGGKSPVMKNMFILGLLAGWLLAVKYTGLMYLGIIIFMISWQYRKISLRKIYPLLCIFLLGTLPGFSWMIWNWVTLGNPVYPFAWSIFGGAGWNEDISRINSIHYGDFGMGKQFLDYILIPWRLAFYGKLDTILFDGAIGPFLLIFIFFAIMSFFIKLENVSRRIFIQGVAWSSIISASFFVFGTQVARFWLPSQMLICVCAAPAVDHFIRHIRGKKIILALFIVLLVTSLGWNYYYLSKRWSEIGIHKPFLGLESEESFLKRKVPGYPVMDYINLNLPDSSRIFSIWTGAYAYYMNRAYYTDTFLEDVTLKKFIKESADGQELAEKLKNSGFTHIFINYFLTEGNMEPRQLEIFRDFIKNKSRLIVHQGNYFLFALDK